MQYTKQFNEHKRIEEKKTFFSFIFLLLFHRAYCVYCVFLDILFEFLFDEENEWKKKEFFSDFCLSITSMIVWMCACILILWNLTFNKKEFYAFNVNFGVFWCDNDKLNISFADNNEGIIIIKKKCSTRIIRNCVTCKGKGKQIFIFVFYWENIFIFNVSNDKNSTSWIFELATKLQILDVERATKNVKLNAVRAGNNTNREKYFFVGIVNVHSINISIFVYGLCSRLLLLLSMIFVPSHQTKNKNWCFLTEFSISKWFHNWHCYKFILFYFLNITIENYNL